MDDFTQFDAFERCREFARGIGVHIKSGGVLKRPRSNDSVAEDIVVGLFKFRRGI